MSLVNPPLHRLFKQSGMALLALIGVIALLASMLFVTYLNNGQIRIERDKKTQQALAEAKNSLLGWSITQNNPGQLPCPENTSLIGESTEGQAAGSCVLPAIGRLPWKTLKLGDIRDGDGERLWYAVSPGYRVSPINTTVPGQLTVNGSNAAVAIIFSSGAALNGQERPIATKTNPPNVTQYLELSNNDGDSSFVTATPSATFNDKVIVITSSELFDRVIPRILSLIKGDTLEGLIGYYQTNAIYPYADSSSDGDTMADPGLLNGIPSANGDTTSLNFVPATKDTLENNFWFPLITYNVTADQQQVTLTLGTKTMIVHP